MFSSKTDGAPTAHLLPSYPETAMTTRSWCAARAMEHPLERVWCIWARRDGQSAEISPMEMTCSRYSATRVLNSWTVCRKKTNRQHRLSGLSLNTPSCILSRRTDDHKKKQQEKNKQQQVQKATLHSLSLLRHCRIMIRIWWVHSDGSLYEPHGCTHHPAAVHRSLRALPALRLSLRASADGEDAPCRSWALFPPVRCRTHSCTPTTGAQSDADREEEKGKRDKEGERDVCTTPFFSLIAEVRGK